MVNVPKLTQRVNTFNWTNEAQLRALLQPGADFGLTDIVLALTEPPSDTLDIFADNQGVEATGRYQAGAYYKKYGLFGMDDRFTFYGTKSEDAGSLAGNFAYNLPVSTTGARLGVSYAASKIKIIEGPTQPLGITGHSEIAAATLSHPIWLDETFMVLGVMSVSNGASKSDQDVVTITDNHTWKATPGFTVSRKVSDGLSFTITPTVSFADTDLRTVQRSQQYILYTGTAWANMRLPADFSLQMIGAWQASSDRVLPGDQAFQIGGPTTVRGYPTNAVSGYSGYYVNVEFHRNWSSLIEGLDTFTFVDEGMVWALDPHKTELMSAGAGLRLNILNRLTAEVSAGTPLNQAIDSQRQYEIYVKLTSHLLGS